MDSLKNDEIGTFIEKEVSVWTKKIEFALFRYPQWRDRVGEVVNDVALKVAKRWGQFEARDNATIDAWAGRIVERCICDFFRRENAKKRRHISRAIAINAEEYPIDVESKELQPLDILVQAEQRLLDKAGVLLFPYKDREIVSHLIKGMTYQEIASKFPHLGSAKAIRQRIYELKNRNRHPDMES